MNSNWSVIIVVEMVIVAGLWMLCLRATETQGVEFGSIVTLGCNISYLYHTTWLKHNPGLTPTVVLCASLREGNPFQEFQLSPRFSMGLMNRSLALRIAAVEERDLGLYYCIAMVNTRLTVGRGTTLQVTPPGSVQFALHNWYCVAIGAGFLITVLSIFLTYGKAKCNNTNKPSATK